MEKWKRVFRTRYYWTAILAILGLLLILFHVIVKNDELRSIFSCIGTSLISAGITMFLIRFDILDMVQDNCLKEYGVLSIVSGRDHVFEKDIYNDIKARDWKNFLTKSTDNTIDIIGISMYSFLITKGVLYTLYELDDKYTIRIVFADPSSSEVKLQSIEEKKEGKLKDNIEWLSKKIKREKPSINLFYSKTLPRAFIVRSGDKMVITPYLLSGPFEEPTIIASNKGYANNTFFETYSNYISMLISSAKKLD